METYTLTWRNSNTLTKTGLRRMRFWVGCRYWYSANQNALESFLRLFRFGVDPIWAKDLRLVKNGRLVARSATYQGV